MATFTQDTVVGTTAGFEFDSFGTVPSRTRAEVNAQDLLQEVITSTSGLTFTVPSESNYNLGQLFSNGRSNGGPTINPNQAFTFVVENNAIATLLTQDPQQFRSGVLDIRTGGTLIVVNNGHAVFPSNSGNSGGISVMRLNGTLRATGSSILHGRGLSPTAIVNLDGLVLLGGWGIQFPPSADWVGVSAPDPALSTSDQGSLQNNRFFRMVQPSLGNVSQRWAVYVDGEWATSTSNVFQINRDQFANATDALWIGDSTQFPNQTEIRLGNSGISSSSDGVIQTLRRNFGWNPLFTDSSTSTPVTDVGLNFTGTGIQSVYNAADSFALKTTQFSSVPQYESFDTHTGGYWIQVANIAKTTADQSPTSAISLNNDTTQTVFSKSFSHLSSRTEIMTEHNKQSSPAVFSESASFPLSADAFLNSQVLDLGQTGQARADALIRSDAVIASSNNIYPALKFGWWGSTESLPFSVIGNGSALTLTSRLATGTVNSSNDDESIFRSTTLVTSGVDTFILDSPNAQSSTFDAINITGNLTLTKGVNSHASHGLDVNATRVTGMFTLGNNSVDTFNVNNPGIGSGFYGGITIGNDVSFNFAIQSDMTIDLDDAWGTQVYGTGVTINNTGAGQISILSTTAGSAGVSFVGNAAILEQLTLTNTTTPGATMRVYRTDAFTTTTGNSATPIETSTTAGGTVVLNLADHSDVIAIITAPGFLPFVIESGPTTSTVGFATPTLTPSALSDTSGLPALSSIQTTLTQSVGSAGIIFDAETGTTSRLSGNEGNRFYTQAASDIGLGRGIILNFRADADRMIGSFVTPTLLGFRFPGLNQTDIDDTIQMQSGSVEQQLFSGINEGSGGAYNRNTATLPVPTSNSIANPTPDAGLVSTLTVNALTPKIDESITASEASRDASFDTITQVNKITT